MTVDAGPTDQERPDAFRRRLTTLVGIVISAVLLIVVLRRVDVGEAWRTMRSADPLLLVAGFVGVNVALIPQAMRWRAMTQRVAPADIPQAAGFLAVMVAAQAVNSVIPARAGDVMRVAWLRRRTGISIAAAAAAMLADRILDVLMLAAILAVGVWFVDAPGWVVTVSTIAAAGCAVIIALWFAARRWIARSGGGTIRQPASEGANPEAEGRAPGSSVSAVDVTGSGQGRVRLLRARLRPLWGRLRRAIVRFGRSFAVILDPCRFATGFALTAVSWPVWTLGALAIAHAIGIDIAFLPLLFVGALTNVGMAIPSSPGFVGTYQWIIIEGLAIFAVGASAGLAYSLVLQAAWLIPQTIAGFVILPRLGVRRSDDLAPTAT